MKIVLTEKFGDLNSPGLTLHPHASTLIQPTPVVDGRFIAEYDLISTKDGMIESPLGIITSTF